MNAFEEHAAHVAELEAEFGSGDALGMATLTLKFNQAPAIRVPVTHTMLDIDWLLTSGRSPITFIERAEFRAELIDAKLAPQLQKELKCDLVIKPGTPVVALQLWNGGPLAGGEIYRFMLVDANFHA